MHNQPRHWSIVRDVGGVAWVTLDKAGSTSNTLSGAVLEELGRVLDWLEDRSDLVAVIFASAKTSGFIMGADVSEFSSLTSREDAVRAAGFGQSLMRRIAELPFPSVAAIDGYALGGGLELALACSYRVAAHSYERSLGLPEVQLGIHPGFGGTVRIVQLLGPLLGLDLMLTGRSLSPVEAMKCGLVDAIVDRASLRSTASRVARSARHRRRAPWFLRMLNLWPLRSIVARRVAARVARRARPAHYPAPFAIIELWRKYGAHGLVAYLAEVESIATLIVSTTCRNLVRVFHLRERLRNLAPRSAAVERVHVVGAGVMGGDIAAWCALRGLDVSLQDREQKFVDPALERAGKLFRRRLKAPGAAAAAADRLVADVAGVRIPTAEVIIEAIVENVDVKREVFASLEKEAPGTALLATNTSSIRIEDIAGALESPGRLAGMHFFNPVASLPLVEVVAGESTADEAMRRAISFVIQIGKLPLPCRSAPGFVVNRVLMPYMLEALRAHEEGMTLASIDEAATRFGMPMGPIELADRVGLDVALHVADILGKAFGGEPPRLLRDKVAAGLLGVKSSSGGFYRYKNGRPLRAAASSEQHPDLEDRLILALCNECIACLADGVVDEADLIDAAVVFGTGFAPFTGGPLHYAQSRGIDAVVERLRELASRYGDRFEPHAGWQQVFRPKA